MRADGRFIRTYDHSSATRKACQRGKTGVHAHRPPTRVGTAMTQGSLSLSEAGYPTSSLGAQALLVLTHLLLIPPMRVAWRIRNYDPFLVISIMGCFLCSTAYHVCYTFERCATADRRLMRHGDHFWSPNMISATALAGIWEVDERGAPRQPWWVSPFTLALFAFHLWTHVHGGIDVYKHWATMLAAFSVVGAWRVRQAWRHGVTVRWLPLVALLVLASSAYAVFLLDDVLGAMGHDLWHFLGFFGEYVSVCHGSVFGDGAGVYISLAVVTSVSRNHHPGGVV